MRMTFAVVIWGGLAVFWAGTITGVMLPVWVNRAAPSEQARPLTALERRGQRIYIANGCLYCHSQYVRSQDLDIGASRVSRAGDYYYDRPPLLGSERTGPDLAQEGGRRTDDWHRAHFVNPRYTRPASIMPPFEFLTDDEMNAVVAYMQALGGNDADRRMRPLRRLQAEYRRDYREGPAANVAHLAKPVPSQWLTMPNPYPPTEDAVMRGKAVYQEWCIGCHGEWGDGRGPAKPYLDPPPFDFTLTQAADTVTNGLIYYQVFHGIPGTAMPPFKELLESENIWDVGQYIGVTFMGWEMVPAEGGPVLPKPGEGHGH